MIVLLALVAGLAAGERTVVVTPRPRHYQPSRFVQEPRRDAGSPEVPPLLPLKRPVISLRVVHGSANSLSSALLPVEHRQPQAGNLSERPIVVMSASSPVPANHRPSSDRPATTPALEGGRDTAVFVESLPSLSIKLQEERPQQELSPIPDYLTPPKYPSVYEKQFATEAKPKDESEPSKKKKRNKKRKIKIESTERNGSRSVKPLNSNLQKFRTQSSGERVEFQLHGQNGPDSYKFGYDTGAGKNRQFRFEEKDSQGNVKGHFGYYDTTGKLQIFSYRADETGFHAEQIPANEIP